MNVYDLKWMKYSIELAKSSNGLHVGAVAVRNNSLVCHAINSENNKSSWLNNFLKEIKKYDTIETLYLTINTISHNCSFDLNKLLKKVIINKIYIGLPDPKLTQYYKNDPVVKYNIKRYPDELQKLILNQNVNDYSNSKQNILYNHYYSTVRISNLILNELSRLGLSIRKTDIEANKNFNSLIQFISNKYDIDSYKTTTIVNNIFSQAFGEKYSSYDYAEDIRSVSLTWKNNFYEICKNVINLPLSEQRILNVGVGSGDEAKALFGMCKDITFADIARLGLNKITACMPHAKTLCCRAENLSKLKDNTYDLYVSLRTYNSSFFEAKPAVREAYRVLKNNGKLIISIANGFLNKDHRRIIRGLIIPNTNFVDIYRGLNFIRELSEMCNEIGFNDINLIPTDTEIYLTANANKPY